MNEFCNVCGRSVESRSGRFVNRTPDFDEPHERAERGSPYPDGDFVCAECDERIFEGAQPGNAGAGRPRAFGWSFPIPTGLSDIGFTVTRGHRRVSDPNSLELLSLGPGFR